MYQFFIIKFKNSLISIISLKRLTENDIRFRLDFLANSIEKVKKFIRAKTSPRHVPSKIIEIPEEDIPYTFSGKKVEITVTKILRGMSVANRGALKNPESLDFYMEMKDKLQ